MAKTDIGRAVPLLKGEYNPATTYELNDIVSLNGSLYWHYSHEETTNVAPQATSTWKVVLSLADAEAYIARAETAAGEAEDAKDAALAAQTAAETASTTATGASATATAARNDAVTAKTAAETALAGAVSAKNDAVTAKEAAQSAASSAGASATNANNSAGTAQYYAESAGTSASTATTKAGEASASASTASTAATTATTKASEASASATTATTKAGEASTSATSAASSAAAAQDVLDSIPEDYSQLSEDVSDLKTQITDITGNTGFKFVPQTVMTTSGSTATLEQVTSANYDSIIVPCSEGNVFTISGEGGFNSRLWAFFKAKDGDTYPAVDDAKSASNATANNLVITAPETAAYLAVNVKRNPDNYTGSLYSGVLASKKIKDLESDISSVDDKYSDIIFNEILPRNSVDIISFVNHDDKIDFGVNFEWTENECHIEGTPTRNFDYYLLNSTSEIPNWLVKGQEYTVNYSATNVGLRVLKYVNGVLSGEIFSSKGSGVFVIPDDATGITISFRLYENTATNESVTPGIYSGKTNGELSEITKGTNKELFDNNSIEILSKTSKSNTTNQGVTYTWSGDVCAVQGQASANSINYLYNSFHSFPDGFVKGIEYTVKYEADNVSLRIGYYVEENYAGTLVTTVEDTKFTIPNNAEGILIALRVTNGTSVNESVSPKIYNALSNKELQNNVEDITKDNNELNAVLSESVKYGIKIDEFELQQVCIHNDNFYRTISGDLWKIGDNGNTDFPMEYYSPYTDYESVDDGFRISDNVLTNNTSTVYDVAFRIIENELPTDQFLCELGAPPKVNGKAIMFVYNFKDASNYNYICVTYESADDIYRFVDGICKNGNVSETNLSYIQSYANSIRILYANNVIWFFADDTYTGIKIDRKIDHSLGLGIMISKVRDIYLKFINLFYFRNFISVNPNYAYDANSLVYPYIRFFKVQDSPDYAHTLNSDITRFSQKSERFELRQTDPYVDGSPRAENSSGGPWRGNLRKIKLSFDLYIPDPYPVDTSVDVLFQMHDTDDINDDIQRMPNIGFGTDNGEWRLTVRGWYGKDNEKPDADTLQPDERDQQVYLGAYTPGTWTHFDIYMKEGYMTEHNPLTQVYINGNLVYQSHAINAYNRCFGAYAKYGIYKAGWKFTPSELTSRIVYVDNFKYEV